MLKLWRSVAKPEYFFRPRQLARRLGHSLFPTKHSVRTLDLPWGATLRVDIGETMGSAVWQLGVYDLLVSETLWRLADPGDTAADVGANIGHMSSVLAARLGARGRVVAFEPHPVIYRELAHNVSEWQGRPSLAPVEIHAVAVAAQRGEGTLEGPADLSHNSGLSRLVSSPLSTLGRSCSFSVPLVTLAEAFSGQRPPAVLKIDTEGNELEVLRGAEPLLSKGSIRDVVFEEHGRYPTATARFLEAHGYKVLDLRRSFFGPRALEPGVPLPPEAWEPTSMLATHCPERALARLRSPGWKVLGVAW